MNIEQIAKQCGAVYHDLSLAHEEIQRNTIVIPTEIRLDQLRQELIAVKDERDKAQQQVKKYAMGLVQIVDALAEYFGKSSPLIKKLLEEVKELR